MKDRSEDVRHMLKELNPEADLIEGMDKALIGFTEIDNRYVAVYHREGIVRQLMDMDGSTEDEAEQHFEYNIDGTVMSNNNPIFVSRPL
jgi:hypothetical protein